MFHISHEKDQLIWICNLDKGMEVAKLYWMIFFRRFHLYDLDRYWIQELLFFDSNRNIDAQNGAKAKG